MVTAYGYSILHMQYGYTSSHLVTELHIATPGYMWLQWATTYGYARLCDYSRLLMVMPVVTIGYI